MGKSLDLPDPLQSASPTPLGNADDLLAQLAGEEVDRLLAASDAEGGGGDAASPANVAPSKPGEPWRSVDPGAQREAAIQDQLDALFAQINAEQPNLTPAPGAAEPVAPPPQSSAVPVPAAAPTVAAAAAVAEAETTAAERQGLAEPDPADELPGPGELRALAAPVEEDEDDAPLPIYLKPLQWLNAPLDLLPQTLRDVLGQIAILTLVNAIAVLIYVFVFRKQ